MLKEQIKNTKTLNELQELYASVFGKNGTMTAKLREMKNLDNDARLRRLSLVYKYRYY